MSGPLVRSSYRAGRLYKQAMEKKSSRGWSGLSPSNRFG
jgi:lipoic acid synthetase